MKRRQFLSAASVGLDKLGAAALQSLTDWQQVISAGAGRTLSHMGLTRPDKW